MLTHEHTLLSLSPPPHSPSLSGVLIPSIPRGATRQAVSIVGAVIMPHNLFLHSALVQSRAIDRSRPSQIAEAVFYFTIESALTLLLSFGINLCVVAVFAHLFAGKPHAHSIGLSNAAGYLQVHDQSMMQDPCCVVQFLGA